MVEFNLFLTSELCGFIKTRVHIGKIIFYSSCNLTMRAIYKAVEYVPKTFSMDLTIVNNCDIQIILKLLLLLKLTFYFKYALTLLLSELFSYVRYVHYI